MLPRAQPFERRLATASPPRPRSNRRRARANPRADGPRAERLRARRVLAALERALRLQALAARCSAASPPSGPRVLQGPGENAGVIDVGDGLAVALKVESHNHPSAVEPFQGAATGVGGILRDIFAMGARPIAILDSLRFGELAPSTSATCSPASSRASATTATASASPTSAARSSSTPAYEHNCLVNAMCVGLLPADRLTSAAGGAASATWSCCTGRAPAATASAAPACWPRRASTRARPTSARACRSATPSPARS